MQQYSCDLINGYPIADIRGRKFLIDTSLPFTLADRPLSLEGARFEVAQEVMGLTTAQVADVAGLELDGVLGANVTDQFVMRIEPEQRKLVLDQYLDAFPVEIEIENLGGQTIMHQTIGGKHMKAFLSLGSHLSYVCASEVEGLEPVGRERDVLAMIGEIETEVYELPVAIGQTIHHFKFGVIPPAMQSFIDMANVQAAIGSELLQHYAISLAVHEGLLMLDPIKKPLH
ncbi:MAG: hypothetical protein V7754_02410 [Halioglobus sp.]